MYSKQPFSWDTFKMVKGKKEEKNYIIKWHQRQAVHTEEFRFSILAFWALTSKSQQAPLQAGQDPLDEEKSRPLTQM